MKIVTDLHSHSGYAGGVGQIELSDVAKSMKTKGIDVFGTGDCLLPQRLKELEEQLIETKEGLFSLDNDSSYFMLQSEIILTVALEGRKGKTIAHHVVLIPSFDVAKKIIKLFEKLKVKNTIGRPFIVSEDLKAQEDFLFALQGIDSLIEIIPAHIMTPDGVLGSKNNLQQIEEFYGSFTKNIRVIETGLSADPSMLEKIPDLANLTYISNSDCHSTALNRIGREFTIIDAEEFSYKGIIQALRNNKIILTAEFNPAQGRYYTTGHRSDRHKDGSFFIANNNDSICKICDKNLDLGVKQRCEELSDPNIVPLKRKFKHLIPLVEVIAFSLNIKNPSAKSVTKEYYDIMQYFNSEIGLWLNDLSDIPINPKIKENIIAVQAEDFYFDPPGFDGQYGVLKVNT